MKYSWYETSEHAVLVVYSRENDPSIKVEKTPTGVTVHTSTETTPIAISHAFEVGEHKRHPAKVEVLLHKSVKRRWRDLCPVEKGFERSKEIADGPKEEYSKDPILNLFREVYAKAGDDAKREMNKSFVESKGQELRTAPKAATPPKKRSEQ